MYENNFDAFIKNLAKGLGIITCDCGEDCKCNQEKGDTCKCKKESECCTPKNSQYYKYSEYVDGKKIFEKEKEKCNGKTIFESEHDYRKGTSSGYGCKPESRLNSASTCFGNSQEEKNIQITPEQMEEFTNKVEYIEKRFEYYDNAIKVLKEENEKLLEDNTRYKEKISKIRKVLFNLNLD